MPEITVYMVAYGDGLKDLEHKVSMLIKEGWQPFPGLTLKSYSSNPSDFYQTMVKYAPSTPNKI